MHSALAQPAHYQHTATCASQRAVNKRRHMQGSKKRSTSEEAAKCVDSEAHLPLADAHVRCLCADNQFVLLDTRPLAECGAMLAALFKHTIPLHDSAQNEYFVVPMHSGLLLSLAQSLLYQYLVPRPGVTMQELMAEFERQGISFQKPSLSSASQLARGRRRTMSQLAPASKEIALCVSAHVATALTTWPRLLTECYRRLLTDSACTFASTSQTVWILFAAKPFIANPCAPTSALSKREFSANREALIPRLLAQPPRWLLKSLSALANAVLLFYTRSAAAIPDAATSIFADTEVLQKVLDAECRSVAGRYWPCLHDTHRAERTQSKEHSTRIQADIYSLRRSSDTAWAQAAVKLLVENHYETPSPDVLFANAGAQHKAHFARRALEQALRRHDVELVEWSVGFPRGVQSVPAVFPSHWHASRQPELPVSTAASIAACTSLCISWIPSVHTDSE